MLLDSVMRVMGYLRRMIEKELEGRGNWVVSRSLELLEIIFFFLLYYPIWNFSDFKLEKMTAAGKSLHWALTNSWDNYVIYLGEESLLVCLK